MKVLVSQSDLQILGGEPIKIWMSYDHMNEEDEIAEIMWETKIMPICEWDGIQLILRWYSTEI